MSKNPIAEQRVVLEVPGMDRVPVRRDVSYGDADQRGLCTLDAYYPPDTAVAPQPAVIFVTGYSDLHSDEMLGCKLKEMAAYVGWARLVACHGMVAITYASEEPVADVRRLLAHVRRNAASLRVDAARLGLWSCSGNVPNALALLADDAELRCAALGYGYMLDEAGCGEVAEGAAAFGFVNPTSDLRVTSFAHVPMLIARAGQDETPGLNASLDRFVTRALAANLPVTVVNHPTGPHAFDLFDPSERSRTVIRQVLGFLRANLCRASSVRP